MAITPPDREPKPSDGTQGAPPGRAFRKLLRSTLSEDRKTVARAPATAKLAATTSDARVRAALETELVAGAATSDALTRCVRTLLRVRAFREARLLIRAARRLSPQSEAADAAAAMLAVGWGHLEEATILIRGLSREAALRLIPAEAVAVELAADRATGAATAAAILEWGSDLEASVLLDLARHLFAHDEVDLAQRALDLIDASRSEVPSEVALEADWLTDWISRARAVKPASVTAGDVAVGVIDYELPDYRHTSVNVGDYIQTLASLGHLLRHEDLRIVGGDPELADTLATLQRCVRSDRRLGGSAREVTVVPVNRDASSLDPIPDGTWVIAFGWYMHSWFRSRYDFPFHPHLRPLFISFHVNRPDAFSEQGIDYLRTHAPIGCRDWPTVRRLHALGIPAFFSGCLTSTVDLLFAPADPPPGAPVALVEATLDDPPEGLVRLSHADPRVRADRLPANLERAVDALDAYRRDYSRVVTSRLHCYLPVRALGVDVEFQRRDENDPRFEGLIGIDDQSFAAMRAGIEDKLEVALSAIIGGEREEAVRRAWRDACAPDVEAARRRIAAEA